MSAPSSKKQIRQSNSPQNISENVWYYEEGGHLCFVVESLKIMGSGPHHTIQFNVPLRMLRKSLSRLTR